MINSIMPGINGDQYTVLNARDSKEHTPRADNFLKSSMYDLPPDTATMSTVDLKAVVMFLIGRTASLVEEYSVYPDLPNAPCAISGIVKLPTFGFFAPIWSRGVLRNACTTDGLDAVRT